MRKFFGFKSIISALVCALCVAFQAKAQTTPVTTYGIGTVGSIQITSITGNSGSPVYNGGFAPVSTTGSNGVTMIFNFSGSITNISNIKPGDKITIPITIAAGSHFPNLNGLSFNSNLSVNGQNLFTVSSNNNIITLTATTAVSSISGEVDFNLQGTVTVWTTGGTMQQLLATTTTYTVGGTDYTINNAAYELQPVTCNIGNNSSIASSASSGTAAFDVYYNDVCTYDKLLANDPSALTDPALDSNLIQVATISANTQISSVTILNNGTTNSYMSYVMPDNSSVANASITSFRGSTAFTQVSVTDTSMAGLDTTMKAGTYAIVKYPDGSYAVIVDWGHLINNPYTQYPAGTNVANYDANSDALMQEAIADDLTAMQNRLNFSVTFANSAVKNSVPVSVRSNLSGLLPNNIGNTLTNTPVNNAPAGQTTVAINYVTQSGVPLRQSILNYGWPQYSPSGNAAGVLQLKPPTDTLGLQLLNPAQVQKFGTASALDITSTTVDTAIVYQDSSVYYPSSGVLQIYYVYASPADLPITGLQLSAQVQANNDVILTWGTLTEINSKDFTVQRSSDGGKTWVTIGTQPTQAANGNSSVPLTYQLTDLSVPIGSYEYRVVETDIDGATTTSNVVQIVITGGSAVYPNPANTLLNVKLPINANNVPYRLISADGKIVLKGTITNTGNYGQISVAGIASDIYFLQITVNNAMQTYEVRIQH